MRLKRLFVLVFLITSSLFSVENTSAQQEYQSSFAVFRQNLNNYNTFIKGECYNTDFQEQCFSYMENLPLISNNKQQFLELVALLSSPYNENASDFIPSFKPDIRTVNQFLRITNSALVELASSLSYLYGQNQALDAQNQQKLIKLNQILMALNGSMIDSLYKLQQLRW